MKTLQWLDGRLVDEDDPALASSADAGDTSAPSCYTSARVTAGRARYPDHHARRLQRDARAIGLGEFDPSLVVQACRDLGRAVFADRTGIVRIEARRGGEGLSLHATARQIGVERDRWSAVTAPIVHHGPRTFAGAKLMHCGLYEEARAIAANAGVDETLLFDKAGRLVEGARTNLLIVDALGRLTSPDLALGAVAGVALEIVSEGAPELTIAAIHAGDVANARELIALNAVRGARPITQLDGRPVGTGGPGPWVERLDELLSDSQ